MSMTRTTVYLSAQAKRQLSCVARRRNRSEAQLIREAVATLLEAEPARPRPNLPVFSGVDPTIAERVDDVLAEGFGTDGLT